jgi:hypothetical protein
METITLPENKEDILAEIISEMASNKDGREALISILRKNGVSIVETDNNEIIYTAIYTALANSRTFRNDLKKAVFNYLKADEEFSNFISPTLGASLVDPTTGQLKLSPEAQARLDAQNKKGRGGFLSGIFSKENAAALSNFAIGVVTNKLSEKANRKQIEEGIKYQVARTEASDKKAQEEKARAKWVIPVVVISGVVVLSIIGYFVYKNMKSKKA